MSTLTRPELAKLEIFEEGVDVSAAAKTHLCEANSGRAATPADYASTSGLILVIEGNTWVNAPIIDYNASFVNAPTHTLDWDGEQFWLRSESEPLSAKVWLPPAFHDRSNRGGIPYVDFGYTHADRLRISPIEGCSMACKFCDLPYKFKYRTKLIADLVDTVACAIADPIQPAAHVLISGGTPRESDVGYLHDVYDAVLAEFPRLPIDIMMVPIEGVFDPSWLSASGINELSVNIELTNDAIARSLMPHKHRYGLHRYLDFLEQAAGEIGGNRVRSMLMVGLEPIEDTLRGVRLIAERGCVPVLSPFRPDASTPLRDRRPPSKTLLEDVYHRAVEITTNHGVSLGPQCVPCSHNTLTFSEAGSGTATRCYGHPALV